MNAEKFILRLEEIINKGHDVLKTRVCDEWGDYVDSGMQVGFRATGLSFFQNLFGKDHPYYQEFHENVQYPKADCIEKGLGILFAAKNELEGGWFKTTRGIISSEIFSDFLEMSSHLLEEGYKDPAAVMAGSVLEKHLRNLCFENQIEIHTKRDDQVIPKKANLLNAELAKAQVISKLDEKAITAWLDLRNKAAHGKYDEYSKEQVKLLIQSITDFMLRVPI